MLHHLPSEHLHPMILFCIVANLVLSCKTACIQLINDKLHAYNYLLHSVFLTYLKNTFFWSSLMASVCKTTHMETHGTSILGERTWTQRDNDAQKSRRISSKMNLNDQLIFSKEMKKRGCNKSTPSNKCSGESSLWAVISFVS